jgi:hypothetical protein
VIRVAELHISWKANALTIAVMAYVIPKPLEFPTRQLDVLKQHVANERLNLVYVRSGLQLERPAWY